MYARLPDVAAQEPASIPGMLDRVGMQGIAMPITLDAADSRFAVMAEVAAQVDLPDPLIKGIHMSRLYRLLDHTAATQTLTPPVLSTLLQAMVESHADCHSRRAHLSFALALMCRQPALVTPDLHGWKRYPVTIDAVWEDGRMLLELAVEVLYSSTCPCSAALARQVLQQQFAADFHDQSTISQTAVLAWLELHGSAATPHSQRSVAHVRVPLSPQAATFGITHLIALVEAALATPVQTAVKRADEQAFAVLNGRNLMYVEDAARKVQQALAGQFSGASVTVRHLESLHAHDAVAHVSSLPTGMPSMFVE